MPFQPYPSAPSGGNEIPQQITGGPAPQTLLNAVKLMYAGAALSVIVLIATIVTAGSVRSRIEAHHPTIDGKPATATQITGLVHLTVGLGIIIGVVGVALWLWMARKNGQGRPWARIVSSVLFVISTLSLLNLRSGGDSVFAIVSTVLMWLVGLGAVILLWLPSSSSFFVSQRRR
jgi:hypothetical protein